MWCNSNGIGLPIHSDKPHISHFSSLTLSSINLFLFKELEQLLVKSSCQVFRDSLWGIPFLFGFNWYVSPNVFKCLLRVSYFIPKLLATSASGLPSDSHILIWDKFCFTVSNFDNMCPRSESNRQTRSPHPKCGRFANLRTRALFVTPPGLEPGTLTLTYYFRFYTNHLHHYMFRCCSLDYFLTLRLCV